MASWQLGLEELQVSSAFLDIELELSRKRRPALTKGFDVCEEALDRGQTEREQGLEIQVGCGETAGFAVYQIEDVMPGRGNEGQQEDGQRTSCRHAGGVDSSKEGQRVELTGDVGVQRSNRLLCFGKGGTATGDGEGKDTRVGELA